jgi:CheY-like chemotaxis protein
MSYRLSRHPELVGVKALVVEDHEDLRELMCAVLEVAGMTVLSAPSASEALDVLRATRVDIIVSDIGMPEEDGYDFIRRVRSSREQAIAGIPAIAVTAYASAEDRARAMLAGFNVHVTKPYDVEELITAVRKVVSNV